ncbi:hypothetical protein [Pseudovibrio ascidiaceicola]|uniref:hypothetical protein n=1 Tax=Pseudovibrio ascidiaceicola TaxID=285279 RepID=UPI00135A84A3|nr:hypothetical protein [Pseudovibrio ascidiaceicola]
MAEDIAKSSCLVCGAGVMIRKNKAQCLYYSCNGSHDEEGKACGTQVRFAEQRSRILEANLTAMNDNQPTQKEEHNGPEEIEQHNESVEQPRRTGTYEDYLC